ncbi:hypothetical protein [Actinomadura terrae]|uniref:hypothetical protein n=1 Tax=Actinomadura terrae TaxID=604353 RepID=UPI001FA78FE4|nr:hypothetical protein [Actinomadura terrae]
MNANEMDQVRGLLSEPPLPSGQARAKALTMLEDEMAGRRVRTERRRIGWPAGLGAGLVAAGAAAAVAIAVTGQGGGAGSSGSPEASGGVDLDRQAVLAAAANAERTPIGRYWYTDRIDGQSYIVRPKTGSYAIVGAASESFHWAGMKKGTGEAYYGRDLPARPLTEADEALWRRAGSPSSFRVWSNDHYYTYSAKVAGWRSSGPEVGVNPRGGGEFLGEPAEEWRNLPSDPAKLAERFLSEKEASRAAGMKGKAEKLRDSATASSGIWRTASILGGTPVPPKVRAGLMRALAGHRGIRAIGETADPLGRRGVALASAERTVTVTGEWGAPKAEQGTYASRTAIVFDAKTGGVLAVQDMLTKPGGPYAEMKPGFIINYMAVRSTGWSDTKRQPPAALPF